MIHESNPAAERAVADVLEAAWSCRLAGLPRFSPIDFYAERDGRVVALVEVKCRARPLADYPVIWIDAHKWWRMLDAAHGLHTPALFVVQCQDALVWCDLITVDGLSTTVDGRDDRGDPNDRDLIVCIPRRHFRSLRMGDPQK